MDPFSLHYSDDSNKYAFQLLTVFRSSIRILAEGSGLPFEGVCPLKGGLSSEGHCGNADPPPREQTNACESIKFP